ncbi:ABC transporter substrate-binding protein [Pelobium sp.]|nr:ABC transporter substrate-binding protein [Pelobium sp.]MDA9555116.1 ABC transporter substrate-binding protein [Pelobium sp.]
MILTVLGACSPKTVSVVQKNPPVVQEPVVKPKAEEPKKEVVTKPKEQPEIVISLLLPFELDALDYKTASLKDLNKVNLAIDFYQGFKMALDSAANQGNYRFKLQVFDAQDDVSKVTALAAKPNIKGSDLIIGPIFPGTIKAFSVYNKVMKTPMVSPLAASGPELFNNPNLITVNNTINQHVNKAVSFIKTQLKPKKVLLIRSGQAGEYKYAVPFKKGIDSLAKGLSFSEIGIKAVGYENVFKSLNPTGLNVVVLPSTERTFLLSIFKELEKLSSRYQIVVIGHPDWEKLQFLDFSTLEKLNTYITSSYQIDYKSSKNLDFIKSYRNVFSLEPSEYAFKGFDIGYYFAKLMNDHGKGFLNVITKQSFSGLHNDFKFVKDAKYGYINAALMILKYQQGQLKRID